LKSLALAVAEILHGVQNAKMGHLTLTMPLSGKIFIGRVGLAMKPLKPWQHGALQILYCTVL